MEGLAKQFAERNEQWTRFAHWQQHHDPVRRMNREDGFRWACEMHEWFIGRFGYPRQPAQPGDFAGLQLMRSRLALLTAKV